MQCVRYLSQRTLFRQLGEDRFKIAAVGSGCSLATEPSAEVSHFFNIPQVNFGGSYVLQIHTLRCMCVFPMDIRLVLLIWILIHNGIYCYICSSYKTSLPQIGWCVRL